MQCFKDMETETAKATPLKWVFLCDFLLFNFAFSFLVMVEGIPRLMTLGILINPPRNLQLLSIFIS